MGQAQSIISVSDAHSTVFETQAFVTSPLDELCDYERLWKEIQEGIRTDFAHQSAVKSMDITDISETQFLLVRKYDPAVLKIPVPPGVTELPSSSFFQLDKSKGEIYEEQRDPMGRIEEVRVIRTLKDPLRMELVAQRVIADPPAWRCGPRVKATFASIMRHVTRREDIQLSVQPARLPGGGHVLVTQALDEVMSFVDLCSGLMEQFRSQAFYGLVRVGSVEVEKVYKDGDHTSLDVFSTWDGAKLVEHQFAKEAQDVNMRTRVETNTMKDPAKKDKPPEDQAVAFSVTAYMARAENRLLVDVINVLVTRQPTLVVECWGYWPVMHSTPPAGPDMRQHVFAATTPDVLSNWCKALALRLGK